MRGLKREGFRHTFILNSPEDIEAVEVERSPMWTNRKNEHGPFDIIGDVHGCYDELVILLTELGYTVHETNDEPGPVVTPPAGRKAIFLGDLVDGRLIDLERWFGRAAL